METKHKAYKLTVDGLLAPWHYTDVVVYAKTSGEAKSKGITEFECAEIKDVFEIKGWREVKFTDIKATRFKEEDKISHGGVLLSRKEVKEKEWVKERDNDILNLVKTKPDSMAVIWAGCYGQYWGANRSGYSSDIKYAGKYTPQEAYDIISGNDYSRQEVVKLLDVVEYNEKIDREVERLLSTKL